MSTAALDMVGLPEINMGINDLKAYMDENPLLWKQPAFRWAVKAMLLRFNRLITDRIDLEILQDKKLLETFFVSSKIITSGIERLRLAPIEAFDEPNRESETESKVVTNAEDSSISQASNPAAGLDVHLRENSILNDTLGLLGSPSSFDRSEDIEHIITQHSDNQRSLCQTTSSDETPLNADGSSIADGESHRGENTTCPKTISAAEHDEPPKIKKKKKKSKKKKTTVGDPSEEAILMTRETPHSPNVVFPMAKDYVLPAGSMPDRLMALSDVEMNSSDQAVATTTLSETEKIAIVKELDEKKLGNKSEKAPEVLRPNPVKNIRLQMMDELRCIKMLEVSRQQLIEELKAEHQKALADFTRKHEAIKFENRNLKADRNKELEKLRKENSTLRGMSSGLEQEVTRLRTELQLKSATLEWTTSKLKNDVYRLSQDNSKLIESNEALLKKQAAGESRRVAKLTEELLGEQSKTKRFSSRIQELHTKVEALEEERAILEPLIEVGVAVRKRFFEQAKYTVSLGEISSRADHKIIKEGNDRCHRGYCLTDAALFKLSYLSGSINEALYNNIYCVRSYEGVMKFPLKLCQALDSKASIRTVRVINDSTTSQELRTEADHLFFSISDCWNKNFQKDIFDANEEVTGWLSELQDLEKQIIRIDRSTEYRGYVEDAADEEETSHSRGWNCIDEKSGGMADTDDWSRNAEEPGNLGS